MDLKDDMEAVQCPTMGDGMASPEPDMQGGTDSDMESSSVTGPTNKSYMVDEDEIITEKMGMVDATDGPMGESTDMDKEDMDKDEMDTATMKEETKSDMEDATMAEEDPVTEADPDAGKAQEEGGNFFSILY